MTSRKSPNERFIQHCASAKQRGIPFELTFDEWWSIWQRSGKWKKRGCRKGQFVIARKKDEGPYASGNVLIIRQEENHRESRPNQRVTQKVRAANAKRSRGSRNGRAKLSEDDVLYIRAIHKRDSKCASRLAKLYGISPTQVYAITKRSAWSHL